MSLITKKMQLLDDMFDNLDLTDKTNNLLKELEIKNYKRYFFDKIHLKTLYSALKSLQKQKAFNIKAADYCFIYQIPEEIKITESDNFFILMLNPEINQFFFAKLLETRIFDSEKDFNKQMKG